MEMSIIENNMEDLQKLKIKLPYVPEISLLAIYLKEDKEEEYL